MRGCYLNRPVMNAMLLAGIQAKGTNRMSIFAKFTGAASWPIAAVLIVAMIICFMPRIAESFRRSPMIRRIKLSSFEIELDRSNLDELKEDTENQVRALIKKIDDQTTRFIRTLHLSSAVEGALNNIITHPILSGKFQDPDPFFRATIHIIDPIFEDQLYQPIGYFFEDGGRVFLNRDSGAGRRFSIRYGIIGLAARTCKSQGVGSAFRGSSDEVQALIERWSMLPEQTRSAKKRPSCLSVVLKDEKTGAVVGLLYADAETDNFFGDDTEACEFANSCESLVKVKSLAKLLSDLNVALAEIRIGFDLVKMGERK